MLRTTLNVVRGDEIINLSRFGDPSGVMDLHGSWAAAGTECKRRLALLLGRGRCPPLTSSCVPSSCNWKCEERSINLDKVPKLRT